MRVRPSLRATVRGRVASSVRVRFRAYNCKLGPVHGAGLCIVQTRLSLKNLQDVLYMKYQSADLNMFKGKNGQDVLHTCVFAL